jgi:hypothetical protein
MGNILDQLLKEIPESDVIVQVREICSKIWEEEKRNIKHPKALPEGANVFLALEVPPRSKGEISYVSLERDPLEEFIVVYYSVRISDYTRGPHEITIIPKRIKTHTIREVKAKKIMADFAKRVKFYRGE